MNALRLIVLVLTLFSTAGLKAQSAITTEGVVEAPVSQVWAAWTTAAGLRSWLAPHADIDLRIGGLMRTSYSKAATLGDASTIENRVLALDPERMLCIQVARAPEDFPFKLEVANMWTVLYFELSSASKTKLKVVSLGFSASEPSQKMRQFFERGNAYTLVQLQKRFGGDGSQDSPQK